MNCLTKEFGKSFVTEMQNQRRNAIGNQSLKKINLFLKFFLKKSIFAYHSSTVRPPPQSGTYL
jgi:hypothetical protein